MAKYPKQSSVLKGKKALIVGVANENSIAYGCARAFHEAGCDLAITYLNEKAKPHVEPLAKQVEASIFAPLDVSKPDEMEALFKQIEKKWGQLDIVVHSIASAKKEDIKGGLLDCSADGFALAMDVSVHSFIRMAKLAAPLMKDGGSIFAMSYLGATRLSPTTTSWDRSKPLSKHPAATWLMNLARRKFGFMPFLPAHSKPVQLRV